MTDLSDLIERVRGVAGADDPTLRYMDCHMWVIGQGGDARMHVCDSSTKDFVWERGMDGLWVRGVVKFRDVPKYTSSIDAITALIEKKLPGWSWNIGHDANDELHATIWRGVTEHDEYAPTGPLALCLAFLLSLQESSK